MFNIILENLYKKITVIESTNAENILSGILKSYIDELEKKFEKILTIFTKYKGRLP